MFSTVFRDHEQQGKPIDQSTKKEIQDIEALSGNDLKKGTNEQAPKASNHDKISERDKSPYRQSGVIFVTLSKQEGKFKISYLLNLSEKTIIHFFLFYF